MDVFQQNVYGSGIANAGTAVLFFLLWFIRQKCKHSKCTMNSGCCTLEVNDDSSEEGERLPPEGRKIHDEIEISVQKM